MRASRQRCTLNIERDYIAASTDSLWRYCVDMEMGDMGLTIQNMATAVDIPMEQS